MPAHHLVRAPARGSGIRALPTRSHRAPAPMPTSTASPVGITSSPPRPRRRRPRASSPLRPRSPRPRASESTAPSAAKTSAGWAGVQGWSGAAPRGNLSSTRPPPPFRRAPGARARRQASRARDQQGEREVPLDELRGSPAVHLRPAACMRGPARAQACRRTAPRPRCRPGARRPAARWRCRRSR